MNQTFGQQLKNLRHAQKLTQKQLADNLHLAESTISMYERGERVPSFEVLELIADYFNVAIDKLYGRTTSELYTDYISKGPTDMDILREVTPKIKTDYLEFAKKLEDFNLSKDSLDLLLKYAQTLKK